MAKSHYRNEEGIKAFGKRLRELRKQKGVSQETLAYSADIHLSQVGRIERGEINTSISFVYLFASILNVEPSEFFEK